MVATYDTLAQAVARLSLVPQRPTLPQAGMARGQANMDLALRSVRGLREFPAVILSTLIFLAGFVCGVAFMFWSRPEELKDVNYWHNRLPRVPGKPKK